MSEKVEKKKSNIFLSGLKKFFIGILNLYRNDGSYVKGPRLFFGYIGLFLILIGFLILVPLIILPFYPEDLVYLYNIVIPAGITIVVGFILFLMILKKPKGRLAKWQSYVLLVSIWVLAIVIAAIPLSITKEVHEIKDVGNVIIEYNFTEAVFELTSCLATCGASIMSSTMYAFSSHLFMFYRFWFAFVGGVGLTLIVTSAISDANGLAFYNLEGHNDRLIPNLIKSARIIFGIYIVYDIIGSLVLWAFGMTPFDAVCHSISSLAGFGLSTHSESLGYFSLVPGQFNAIGIEITCCVLMILGGTSFMIHFALWTRKFKVALYHSELYSFIIMAIIIIPILTSGYIEYVNDTLRGLRIGVFSFISMTTTTGFVIEQQAVLPSYAYIAVIFCMTVGSQAGSTTGGIKQIRLVKVLKNIFFYIRSNIDSPHLIKSKTIVLYGEKTNIEEEDCHQATSFVLIYIIFMLFGGFIFSCYGYRFDRSLTEFASLLSDTGITNGIIAPNAPAGILWMGTIGMLVGRLEPLIFFMLLGKGFKSLREIVSTKYNLKKLFKGN